MITIWNALPACVQRLLSKYYAHLYVTKWSRNLIPWFCKFNNLSHEYLEQFVSAEGKSDYQSFQSFFTRRLKRLKLQSRHFIWPCEGYVCQQGLISEVPLARVKGDVRGVQNIFAPEENKVPEHYSFINIFLHNHNYHRIHAPVAGTIRRIQKIAGGLTILRPWAYAANDISRPALRNERVNIDIEDGSGRIWFLSIVGGLAVGTIQFVGPLTEGSFVELGQELAVFLLGSTCCLAIPFSIPLKDYLAPVKAGERLISEAAIQEHDSPSLQQKLLRPFSEA